MNLDLHIQKYLEIKLTDLPDNKFYDSWEKGLTIEEMAKIVVKDTIWNDVYLESIDTKKDPNIKINDCKVSSEDPDLTESDDDNESDTNENDTIPLKQSSQKSSC